MPELLHHRKLGEARAGQTLLCTPGTLAAGESCSAVGSGLNFRHLHFCSLRLSVSHCLKTSERGQGLFGEVRSGLQRPLRVAL